MCNTLPEAQFVAFRANFTHLPIMVWQGFCFPAACSQQDYTGAQNLIE